jgi:anti-sigma factor RsiW
VSECEYAGRLSAYHDGELDAATRAALEQHLRRCASCAAELGRIRRLSQLLGDMPRAELSPWAVQRLHRAVETAYSGSVRRLAAALTAVAAAVLVACNVWLWRPPADRPAGPMPIWEASVLQRPTEPSVSTAEDQLAMWVVQDLSQEDGQ